MPTLKLTRVAGEKFNIYAPDGHMLQLTFIKWNREKQYAEFSFTAPVEYQIVREEIDDGRGNVSRRLHENRVLKTWPK